MVLTSEVQFGPADARGRRAGPGQRTRRPPAEPRRAGAVWIGGCVAGVNMLLEGFVLRPVRQMADAAERVSTGRFDDH